MFHQKNIPILLKIPNQRIHQYSITPQHANQMEKDCNQIFLGKFQYSSVYSPYVKAFTQKTRPNNPVIITSFAGCQEQAPHCDWNIFDFSGDDSDGCPYGFLLCIDETCQLVVWESSHLTVRLGQIDEDRLPEKKCIHLTRGDVLIFRGDLIHAGAAYEIENVRLHCYLDPTGTNRGSNQTFPFNLFPCSSLKEHVSKP